MTATVGALQCPWCSARVNEVPLRELPALAARHGVRLAVDVGALHLDAQVPGWFCPSCHMGGALIGYG